MRSGEMSSILSKPDPDKIIKMLNKFSLGELHFREMIS